MTDPARTYSDDEQQVLARNLREITEWVYRMEFAAARIDRSLLCELHSHLFKGVRTFAGIARSADRGTDYLTFGPNRSAHRSTVEQELESVFTQLERAIRSFDDNPMDPDYERKAIELAVWTHAQVIKVHPFEDGNGRTSRLLLNCVLIRLGLRPVATEVPRQEYRESLNHYFRARDIQPIVDLYIRLASEQIVE